MNAAGQMAARHCIDPTLASSAVVSTDMTAGQYAVGPGGQRLGQVLLPTIDSVHQPLPLALLLHGAGGTPEHSLDLLRPFIDAAGVIVVAPKSRSYTWDLLVGGYGPDVDTINQLLQWTLERCQVSRHHFAIGGFSDGASYALSLGLDNGKAFTHIIALSPGFAAPVAPQGRPRIFISHGMFDKVLSIDPCSRRIAPRLTRGGYRVDYHEFHGDHTVPKTIAERAVQWLMNAPKAA